jgi:hypothetical protein
MQHPPMYPHPLPREPLFLALLFEQFSAQAIAAYDPAYFGRPYLVVSQAAADSLATVRAQSPWVTSTDLLVGIPLHALRRRYPGIEIVTRNTAFEAAARAELGRLYERYTPVFSIDAHGASLLDLTATPAQRSGAKNAIEALTQEIRLAVGLWFIAAGGGSGPLIAKIMARSARPAGVMLCPVGSEAALLTGLDLRLLPGLSTACRERCAKYGLRTAGQVHRLGRAALVDRFGPEGELLYALTGGNDTRPVASHSPSIVVDSVLDRDTNDAGLLLHTVRLCVDKLCHELKTRNLATGRLAMTLNYRDNKKTQKTVTFAHTLDDFNRIAGTAVKLFKALYTRRVGIRSIVLRANKPQTQSGQLSLFDTPWEEKQRSVSRGITDVRRRMSFDAVLSASDVPVMRAQRERS